MALLSGSLPLPDDIPQRGKTLYFVISYTTMLLSLFIFYMHAKNCNALIGFFVTFLVNIVGNSLAVGALLATI